MRTRLAIALAALAALGPANPADAASPSVTDLRVVGYDGAWTAKTNFELRWTLRPEGGEITKVAYGLLGGPNLGKPRLQETWPEAGEMSRELEIPMAAGEEAAASGVYAVVVTAETKAGQTPTQLTTLRIDRSRPQPPAPWLEAAWHRGDVAPVLRISRPVGPPPLSGIRGYAVAVRRGAPAPPCGGPDRCTVEETDLGAGIEDDQISLGLLPEGVHMASVVAVSTTGMRSAMATVPVGIDATRPDLALDGVGGGWSDRPVRVRALAVDALSGMAAAGPNGPQTTIAIDGGAATVAQGEEAATIVSGSGVHTVAAGARDAAGNVRGGPDSGAPARLGVVRIDEDPPAVAFTRAADPADPELLEAVVTDSLSGPGAGGSIGVRPLGSGGAFEPLPTSSSGGRLSARWDSDSYPPGGYEFRASGYDAAGNLTSSTRRVNGAPLILANPVKVPTAVDFGFGGRRLVWHRCVREGEGRRCRREVIESLRERPATRVVPFGRGVGVAGRAVTAAGAPLVGVGVELVESFDAGAAAGVRVTRLRTGPDGAFFARLASGPSRQVEARFGGGRLHARAGSRPLRLGVQSAVRFRASTTRAAVGGAPVLFSGRVLRAGARIPPYGRPVQLQFRLPGLPWTEFRTVQTDERGRFRYPYSFSDDDSRGVRFLFRAYAPPQPGWPYEPAASRPLAVSGY